MLGTAAFFFFFKLIHHQVSRTAAPDPWAGRGHLPCKRENGSPRLLAEVTSWATLRFPSKGDTKEAQLL